MATAMLKHADENKTAMNTATEKPVTTQNETSDKGKKPAVKPQYRKPAATAAGGNKDPPPRPSSAPPTETATSSKPKAGQNTPNSNIFNKEALEILREMNKNINKTNEKVEALSIRVDNMSNELDQNFQYDNEYDSVYDDGFSVYDNDDEQVVQADCQDNIEEEDEENEAPRNVFSKFTKIFKKSDITSDAVDESLAEIVNEAFREGMSNDTFEAMVKEIHRPSNCESLKETKVNSAVWSVLRQHTQNEDAKLRGIQNCMVKATCNIVKVLQKQASNFEDKTLDMAMNAIGLLGQGNRWLNARRKEYHKRDMDPRLHHLCSSSTSFTDQLYGDTIVKDIKDIQETNKISRNVGGRSGNKRVFRGGAKHLRGRRGGPYPRRGGGRFNQANSQNRGPKNGQKGAETKK